MPKPCSQDLRVRLIEAVESGAPRREAAESLDVSASSGVRWMQRWCATGIAAGASGCPLCTRMCCKSPIEARGEA